MKLSKTYLLAIIAVTAVVALASYNYSLHRQLLFATVESTTHVLPIPYLESKNTESDESISEPQELITNIKSEKTIHLSQKVITNAKLENTIHLPREVIMNVKQFILFIGYPRSGHSIVGSLLDAHPNVVVAHEFQTLQWLTRHSTLPQEKIRDTLFDQLFQNTYNNVFKNGIRTENNKGYNLTVENSWQGRYRQHIDVIGGKNGGALSQRYYNDRNNFNAAYDLLTQIINVKFIHCVRNPFDIISTIMLYNRQEHQKNLISSLRKTENQQQYKDDKALNKAIDYFFKLADSVANISQNFEPDILEIHNYELVSHPVDTMDKLCQYLNVHCTREYVQSCAHKVFPKLSRTRYHIDWPEETKELVQKRLEQYSYFDGYSYDSSI